MKVYPNVLSQNDIIDQKLLTYSFQERGLQFGDGIYEVIRIYQGTYYLLTEHIDRLFRSAEAIKLQLPFSKSMVKKQLESLLKVNQITSDAKVYMQITRGTAIRNHIFPNVEANFYAYAQELPRPLDLLTTGVDTIIQPDVRWQNCYIKSLNLLPNVLAKQNAYEQNCFEAIFHRNDVITECSSSNLYMVKNGTIYTHPETNNILHGCVRQRIKQLVAALKVPLIEEAFTIEQLYQSDELFLSSSTAEIMPIIHVEGKQISDGKPGPTTRILQRAYEKDAKISEQ
ncbi:D-amino-acid transaminase [Aquibacillus saliphilus]|uniref:D-amino-acid transaminase n=1 Tax=Aquibacillus saliphilus TaxID=1909422 RepID=UPI001CEFC887|nr:D-amino-acid transaminase [Aquibacillus saliphilus]